MYVYTLSCCCCTNTTAVLLTRSRVPDTFAAVCEVGSASIRARVTACSTTAAVVHLTRYVLLTATTATSQVDEVNVYLVDVYQVYTRVRNGGGKQKVAPVYVTPRTGVPVIRTYVGCSSLERHDCQELRYQNHHHHHHPRKCP